MTDLATFALPLLASAFGGGIVAGAFSIFNRVASRNEEHEQWLRDQKIESYGTFLNASHALVVACSGFRGGQVSTEDTVTKFSEAQLGPLELLAHPEVRAAAEELEKVTDNIFHAIVFGDSLNERPAFLAAIQHYRETKNAFLALARKDLKIPHDEDSVSGSELAV